MSLITRDKLYVCSSNAFGDILPCSCLTRCLVPLRHHATEPTLTNPHFCSILANQHLRIQHRSLHSCKLHTWLLKQKNRPSGDKCSWVSATAAHDLEKDRATASQSCASEAECLPTKPALPTHFFPISPKAWSYVRLDSSFFASFSFLTAFIKSSCVT